MFVNRVLCDENIGCGGIVGVVCGDFRVLCMVPGVTCDSTCKPQL